MKNSSIPADQCPACGAPHSLAPFSDRDFSVAGATGSADLKGLSGEQCAICGEVFFTAESAQRFADAADRMAQQARFREFLELSDRVVLSSRSEIREPAGHS